MSKTHIKIFFSIIDNIDGNLIKICFYESYINIKIIRNLNTKFMSKIITRLNEIHKDF